jgi:hypothetical protein
MRTSATLIGPLLEGFFVEHLLQHKHVSPQTIASYRDAFRLLLLYAHEHLKTEPTSLEVTALDAEVILSFLDSLERDRKLRPIAQHPPSGHPLLLPLDSFARSRSCGYGDTDTRYSREAN